MAISTRGRSILVVEDDPKLADVLSRALQRRGHTCTGVESGDRALWAVSAESPDGIVLDVMIPHPSGLEVCRHLRAGGYTGAIVIISARSSLEDQAATRRAGADAFLAKPFALHELIATLDLALASEARRPDRLRRP